MPKAFDPLLRTNDVPFVPQMGGNGSENTLITVKSRAERRLRVGFIG